ncbi:MAG TPA: hypothetical protein VGN57_04230 [Pirellulaceae bacterium]|jgi:zinc transporter ZupT|nr:hypothetical protein [Pirellulaceae bacterium]
MLEQAGPTFCGALALALVHVLAGRLRFLDVVPRSRWLSLAGGVAVAYAIVHLLPELEERRRTIADAGDWRMLEHLLYLIVLAGLVCFYGMEKLAQRRRPRSDQEVLKSEHESPVNDEETPDSVFWIHVGSFALYNAFIGYALVKEDRDLRTLVLYVVAIGFHFLVNDHGLRKRHQRQYAVFGRWALSGTVLAGWAAGLFLSVWPVVTAAILGFLAGGILLNTFKEELPSEQESRFWVFGAGAAVYSAALLLT